jgi:hypothetical protein
MRTPVPRRIVTREKRRDEWTGKHPPSVYCGALGPLGHYTPAQPTQDLHRSLRFIAKVFIPSFLCNPRFSSELMLHCRQLFDFTDGVYVSTIYYNMPYNPDKGFSEIDVWWVTRSESLSIDDPNEVLRQSLWQQVTLLSSWTFVFVVYRKMISQKPLLPEFYDFKVLH